MKRHYGRPYWADAALVLSMVFIGSMLLVVVLFLSGGGKN